MRWEVICKVGNGWDVAVEVARGVAARVGLGSSGGSRWGSLWVGGRGFKLAGGSPAGKQLIPGGLSIEADFFDKATVHGDQANFPQSKPVHIPDALFIM